MSPEKGDERAEIRSRTSKSFAAKTMVATTCSIKVSKKLEDIPPTEIPTRQNTISSCLLALAQIIHPKCRQEQVSAYDAGTSSQNKSMLS